MNSEQLMHYERKLAFEIDSWDLFFALANGEALTIVDSRSPAAFTSERIPGAINLSFRISRPQALGIWTLIVFMFATVTALAAAVPPKLR